MAEYGTLQEFKSEQASLALGGMQKFADRYCCVSQFIAKSTSLMSAVHEIY